jgi:hypothetical protein
MRAHARFGSESERLLIAACPGHFAAMRRLMTSFGRGLGTPLIQLKACEFRAHENSIRVVGPNNEIGYRFGLSLPSPTRTLQTS